MGCGRRLVGSGCLAGVVYAVVLRPRLVRWGASDEEVARPFPGEELIPDGTRAATMAVTIEAPPAEVWPWLVQMGWDRAGWYSWDRLDNGGRRSAHELHPEWQRLSVGDRLTAWSPAGPVDAWEVAALEPERFLGLHGLSDLRGRVLDPRPATTGVLHGGPLGLPPGGAASGAHAPHRRRLPDLSSSMARRLLQLLGVPAGSLADAGQTVCQHQAQRRGNRGGRRTGAQVPPGPVGCAGGRAVAGARAGMTTSVTVRR